MTPTFRIGVIPDDGIGKEVLPLIRSILSPRFIAATVCVLRSMVVVVPGSPRQGSH